MKTKRKYIGIAISILLLGACSKSENTPQTETAKSEIPTTQQDTGITKGTDDIALGCTYNSNNGDSDGKYYVLIYSPKYNVSKFGAENADGEWSPEYKINNKDVNISQVTFDVTSYNSMVVKQLNPSADFPPEKIIVNRETLDTHYETNSKYAGFIRINYKCELLPSDKFSKHVQWVIDNTEQQKQKNKI